MQEVSSRQVVLTRNLVSRPLLVRSAVSRHHVVGILEARVQHSLLIPKSVVCHIVHVKTFQ